MKKSALSAWVVSLLFLFFYTLTAAPEELAKILRQQLDAQVSTLQKSGFSIRERVRGIKKEHFVLSFDDPAKIEAFLKSQGVAITLEDAWMLQGLQIGADIRYLPERRHILSADLYPVTLPQYLKNATNPSDRQAVAQLEAMLRRQTFLLHLDINTMLSGFSGYLKDVNATIEDPRGKINLLLAGIVFKGAIKEKKLHHLSWGGEEISLHAGERNALYLQDLNSTFMQTGESPYDTRFHYTVGTVKVVNKPLFSLQAHTLQSNLENHIRHGLMQSTLEGSIARIKVEEGKRHRVLEKLLLNLTIDKIDIASLEALQQTDTNDTAQIDTLVQRLLSKNISLTLPEFSVQNMMEENLSLGGFSLNGSILLAKPLGLNQTHPDPLPLLHRLEMQTDLTVSQRLYTFIMQDPRAMLLMMMAPPVSKKGKMYYHLGFSHGKLTINGISF